MTRESGLASVAHIAECALNTEALAREILEDGKSLKTKITTFLKPDRLPVALERLAAEIRGLATRATQKRMFRDYQGEEQEPWRIERICDAVSVTYHVCINKLTTTIVSQANDGAVLYSRGHGSLAAATTPQVAYGTRVLELLPRVVCMCFFLFLYIK
jgi:hypothetical protein